MFELRCYSEDMPEADLQNQQTSTRSNCRQQKNDGDSQNQRTNLRRSTAWLSFPHSDGATHPLHVLKIVDGSCFSLLISQVDEGKTPLTTCLAIQRHGALAHLAVFTEQMDEVFSLSVPGEISNEDGQKTFSNGDYGYFLTSPSTSVGFTHGKS